MHMKNAPALTALALVLLGGSGPAFTHDAGDWIVRFGVSTVAPKSNNHPIADVDSGTSLTFNFAKMLTERWSVELLAAAPFEHDIDLKDGTKVGRTKHLPPTISLQYHLNPQGAFQPYVGAGVNYTTFFSEKTYNDLEGTDLSLGGSWGLAGEIGVDFRLRGSETWLLNLSARYIDIETKAKIDGASIGDVDISPMVYGLHIGYKF
jgi:outer membrane protein